MYIYIYIICHTDVVDIVSEVPVELNGWENLNLLESPWFWCFWWTGLLLFVSFRYGSRHPAARREGPKGCIRHAWSVASHDVDICGGGGVFQIHFFGNSKSFSIWKRWSTIKFEGSPSSNKNPMPDGSQGLLGYQNLQRNREVFTKNRWPLDGEGLFENGWTWPQTTSKQPHY